MQVVKKWVSGDRQPDPSHGPGPANTQLPRLGSDLFYFSKESLYCKIIYTLKYTFIYVS